MSLAGFAVAGGRSRRMGRDKALLPWKDGDLLGHALARLLTVTGDVRVLAGARARYHDRGQPIVVDPAPDLGPLGGLLAALDAAPSGALLLGLDLPLVPTELLVLLAALGPDADAVVPVSPRGPEPLCAAYGPGCREAVRRRVAAGELRMTSFWPDVRVREVGPDELSSFGDPETIFLNVNDREAYERALSLA